MSSVTYPDLKRRTFLEPWEPLSTPKGDLIMGLYEHEDGLRQIYAWKYGEDIRGRERERDVTQIGYRVWPEEVQFLGMSVSYGMQGTRIGQEFLEHFMRTAESHEGVPVAETGLIYKPLVALTLKRAGLKPMSEDCLVEILPRSSQDHSSIPKIHLVQAPPSGVDLVGRSPGGRFYEIVPPEEVLSRYPITHPDKTVALNTRYVV